MAYPNPKITNDANPYVSTTDDGYCVIMKNGNMSQTFSTYSEALEWAHDEWYPHITPEPRPEDIFVWCDGTWCFRYEYEEMSHMSDDFKILLDETPEHTQFMDASE